MMNISFFTQIRSLNRNFWFINFLQMFERISYAAVVLQMAVYIAQKDLDGGLQWSHTTKGTIFFIWALVQNLTPVFLGGFADKFGNKKILIISSLFVFIGYFLLGSQREYYPFLLGTIFLGFGLGLYKPTIQGWIARNISSGNESLAWGINVMLVNFAVFFAPLLASALQNVSWNWLFWGSGLIFSVNFLSVFFVNDKVQFEKIEFQFDYIKTIFLNLLQPKLLFIVITMSGFTMIYMQFYETLPNFIFDWINTAEIVKKWNLPEFLLVETNFGKILDFKYLYGLNSAIIVLFVVIISYITRKLNLFLAILIGVFLATIGLFLTGISNSSEILLFGIIVYTFGELTTNPKFVELMAKYGGNKNKSMYLGFMNISFAIGLGGGSLLGGWLYHHFAEKSGLAIRYLQEKFNINNISHNDSLNLLMEKTNLSYQSATDLLWNTYNPYIIWFVFLGIGVISIILINIIRKKKIDYID